MNIAKPLIHEVALLVTAISLLFGQSHAEPIFNNNNDYAFHFKNCVLYNKNKNPEYDKAVASCTMAYQANPEEHSLLLHIGRNLQLSGKYEEALESYEKYQRARQRLSAVTPQSRSKQKETLNIPWSCSPDATEQPIDSLNALSADGAPLKTTAARHGGELSLSSRSQHDKASGLLIATPPLRLADPPSPSALSEKKNTAELQNQEAVKQRTEEAIQENLIRYYKGLDIAFDEALRQDGSKRDLLLLRGCTQLFLGNTRPAMALFERYQREESKISQKFQTRLLSAYQSLLEKLAAEVHEEMAAHPNTRLPARLLAGRVLTAKFMLDHSSAETVGIQAAEDAICNFDRYWEPTIVLKHRKAPPTKDPFELEAYQTAAKNFKAVYSREKDLSRLPLFIGRAYWLAGEPSVAKRYHEPFVPEPGDNALHKRYLADDQWLAPVPIYKKWYFWVGIVGGVGAAAAIAGGVWAATRPPQPQIMPF